jgi:large subunit ribosomal protein L24
MERKFNKQQKQHVRTGDTVEVIAGNAKGKRGVISEVIAAKQRVVVSGVNIMKKHVKPSAQSPQGEIREFAAPVHISNVMLVDPATGETTRTGRKENDKGKLQRFSKETGKFI